MHACRPEEAAGVREFWFSYWPSARLQFAVATKLKKPEVHLYQVDADPQQIDRVKRIVDHVWEGIERQIFYPTPSAMQCPICPYRRECRRWAG